MLHWLRNLLFAVVGFAWPVAPSLAQSPPPPSQQSPPGAEAASPNPAPSQDKPDSVAEAARKAKQKRASAAKGKVFTEDDLAGLKDGVSVVGTENKKQVWPSPRKAEDAREDENGEAYWRGKAQPILQQMAEIDQRTTQLREDIKKYGSAGIDVATGMKAGVAYVEDRNAQIAKLARKRGDLQKQLDELEEQGRKAGAQPAWFR